MSAALPPGFDAVTPRLLLGPAPDAAERGRLAAAGVTHVLDLRAEVPSAEARAAWAGTGVVFHRDPMVDDGRRQPAAAFRDGVAFVADALATPGARVLVHCAAGQYRSPAVAYAVLRAAGLAPPDAWGTVHGARRGARSSYVASAEAAVPSLPPIDPALLRASPAPGPSPLAVAAGVVLVVGAAYLLA